MPEDVYTETQYVNEGSSNGCIGSILAMLAGLFLIAFAFYYLFANERVAVSRARALNEGHRIVVSADAGTVQAANEGKLVHITGLAQAGTPPVDPVFHVSMKALRLKRKVSMYQWDESRTSDDDGYGKREVTYRYRTDWSSDPIDSTGFRYSEGHANPPWPCPTVEVDASPVRCGAFRLSDDLVARIDNYEKLPAKSLAARRIGAAPRTFRVCGNEFYRGQDPAHPNVGDVKVEYDFAPASIVSVVAMQKNNLLTAYHAGPEGDVALLRVGAFDSEQMFREAYHQNGVNTWRGRLIGFIAMMTGLGLASRFVLAILRSIPFVGIVLETLSFVAVFLLSLVLTLATIAVGWLYYRPIEASCVLGLGAAALVIYSRNAKLRRLRGT